MTACLILPGSARRDSFNKKLARVAEGVVRDAGLEPTFLDMADHRLPLYDGDLEEREGLPPEARALKEILGAHPAWLVVSPEYNASIPAPLKNLIDWVSRPEKGEPALAPFRGKTASLMSASPGALGGIRGLVPLRLCLSAIKVTVLPEQFSLVKAGDAFDDGGALKDPKHLASVRRVVEELAAAVRRNPS